MPIPTTIVTKGATIAEQPIEYGWAPTRGYFTKREWKGTQQEIQALVPQVLSAGYEYVVQGGPVWTLTANINSDTSDGNNNGGEVEIPYPQFELFNQVSEKDLFESNNQFINQLRPDLLRIVQQDCSQQRAPTFTTSSVFSQIEKNYALDVYVHYMSGAKSVQNNIPVLRKSYSISNNYNVAASTIYGTNKLWTTSGLINYENVPFAIQPLMPNSANQYKSNTTYGIWFIDGWLKSAATYQQIAANRFSVNVDFTFGKWPLYIYGSFIA